MARGRSAASSHRSAKTSRSSALSEILFGLNWRGTFLYYPLVLLVAVSVSCPRAKGQVPSTGNTVNAETATPSPGGHDYIHFLGETVSPSNGSLSVNIQFPTPKGRGISLPYSFTYNSAGLYRLTETPTQLVVFKPNNQRLDNLPQASWTESQFTPPQVTCPPACPQPLPFAQCNYATNFTFNGLSGASHNLGIGVLVPLASQNNQSFQSECGTGSTVPSANNGIGSSGGGVGDGKVSAIFSDQPTSVNDVSNWNTCPNCDPVATGPVGDFTVTDESGTTYFFHGNCSYDSTDDVCKDTPYQIEDRNGNQITASSALYNDTVGRQLFVGNQSSTTIGGITYQGASCPGGGCPSSTSVNYAPLAQTTESSGWGEVVDCPWVTPGTSFVVSGTQPAWGGINLPSVPSTTQYTFYYGGFNPTDSSVQNVYGLLNEIIYPSGGWVKYTWKLSSNDPGNQYTEMATFSGLGETSKTLHPACFARYATPVLASRTVSYDGTTVAQTQTFTYTTVWPSDSNWASNPEDWSTKSTTVVTQDNIQERSFQTVYNYTRRISATRRPTVCRRWCCFGSAGRK